MPKTPTGAKRPADVTRNAVLVTKITTGEVHETVKAPAMPSSRAGSHQAEKKADPRPR
jgi:hypothetical protein